MQFKFCFSYSKSWTFAIYDVAQFSKNEIKNFIKNANSTTKHGFALNFTEKLNSKKVNTPDYSTKLSWIKMRDGAHIDSQVKKS